MKENKRTYREVVVSIKLHENDLIRTSGTLEQEEVAISWDREWSFSWES